MLVRSRASLAFALLLMCGLSDEGWTDGL
jgi:hypothetical protein